ncbi:hypothetical protein ACWC1D_12180 [Streptomyces sp. NPDC001478]
MAVHAGQVDEERTGEISSEDGGQRPVARGANRDVVPVSFWVMPCVEIGMPGTMAGKSH